MAFSRSAMVALTVVLVLAMAALWRGGGAHAPQPMYAQNPKNPTAVVQEGIAVSAADPPARELLTGEAPGERKPQGHVVNRESPVVVVHVQNEEGDAVEGVRIEFMSNGVAIAEVDTDAGGRATTVIHSAPAGRVTLCARVASRAAWGALNPVEQLGIERDALPPMIELESIRVRHLAGCLVGVLLESESGLPIANAEVLVKMGPVKAHITGPDGRFELPLDTTSECHGFEVAAPNHQSRRWRGLPPGQWSSGRYEVEDVRLGIGVATSATVVDNMGLPVSGVTCNVDLLSLWTGTSLADGSLALPGLQEGRRFEAVAFGRGYGPTVVTGEARQGGEMIFRMGAIAEWVVSIDRVSDVGVRGRLEFRGVTGSRMYVADSREVRCLRLPGDSALVVKLEGYGEEVVEVADASSSELRFALRSPARYVGVVSKGGVPVEGVGVRCGYGKDGAIQGLVRVKTDAVGAFVIEGVGVEAFGIVLEFGGVRVVRRFDPNGVYSL